jgi:hypothetical protein
MPPMARLPKLVWMTGLSVILASAVLPGCGDDDGDDDGTGGSATGGKGGSTGGKGGSTGGKGGSTTGGTSGGATDDGGAPTDGGAPVVPPVGGAGGADEITGGSGPVGGAGGASGGDPGVVGGVGGEGGGSGGVPVIDGGEGGIGGSGGAEVDGGAGGAEEGGAGGAPPVATACTGASLVSNVATPSDIGVAVTLTADSSGCDDPEFEFYGRGPGETEWTNLQAYSADETLSWTTTGEDAGTYDFQVWVRNDGSTATYEAFAQYQHVLETP